MIDQHSNLAEKFIKKGFWLYFFSFIMAPIGYIVKIMISGDISVSELGIIYGILSLIILLAAYNDLGLTDSLSYFIPKYIQEKRYDKVKTILVYTIIAQLITGSSIAAFFYFGAEFISTYYFGNSEAIESLKIFAFFFLGINIFQVISTFFMSIQNTFYNKVVEFLRMLFVLISCLFIFFSDLGNIVYYSYTWII
jgi:O-antigen/teichoic acid export membrane protein